MAQTWPFSRRRKFFLALTDVIGRALTWPLRRAGKLGRAPLTVHRVLVIEPWNVGDVVLATPILRELRRRYPEAKISVLAKPYARALLHGSGLVDEIISFDIPWTAQRNKYRFTPAILREMRSLVRTLRERRFDVTLDSRMDIRSNILAAMSGAPYRLGYDIGGGGWLITHALPGDRDHSHKIDDWLALLDLLPDNRAPAPARVRPQIVVTEEEHEQARNKLTAKGANTAPVIAYHPGGSHAGKRWPRARFLELMRELRASLGGSHIVFLGPDEKVENGWGNNIVFRVPLRELMAMLTCCDVLVCNDSGPMHVADALGVPVVAIFEIGNPQWFGPSGPRARVIRGEFAGIGLSAAPLERPPRNPVEIARVASAVKEVLAERA